MWLFLFGSSLEFFRHSSRFSKILSISPFPYELTPSLDWCKIITEYQKTCGINIVIVDTCGRETESESSEIPGHTAPPSMR